jgi:hypothetical protein
MPVADIIFVNASSYDSTLVFFISLSVLMAYEFGSFKAAAAVVPLISELP